MSRTILCAALVAGIASLAAAAPKGTVPRSSAERYAVHSARDGVRPSPDVTRVV